AYGDVYTGDERWRSLETPSGELFAWEPDSTYVRQPPYFEGMPREPGPVEDVSGARCLVMLGDSVTTDHISPAGAIRPDSPAGQEYGSGSSRDWAAKGPSLLGVRAVIAESYERIHRSNLLMMGVLPLQFAPGESSESLGLTGHEEFSVVGVENGDASEVTVRADDKELRARVRLDTPREREYFRHGGI